ncbi:MAG: long-chain fatty acid--CoA ligase [Acidimicrobiia bacterium]
MQIFEPEISTESIQDSLGDSTMINKFFDTVKRDGEKLALRSKTNPDANETDIVGEFEIVQDEFGETWRTYSWQQYGDAASRFATVLKSLGVVEDDRVMMLLRNCPAFHICDVGIMVHGATPVSIYHSSSPEQIKYLISHSGSNVIIAEHNAFVERIAQVVNELPMLKHLIMVEDPANLSDETKSKLSSLQVHYLNELVSKSEPADENAARSKTTKDDICTIIYTSGTTGPPKGVALTQSNILFTTESLVRRLGIDPINWRVVSYLPMAHIAERMVSHYLGMRYGWALTCCPDATLVSQYLGPTKPHALFAVPRIWEKAYGTINAFIDDEKKEKFNAALDLGNSIAERKANGIEISQQELDDFSPINEKYLRPWRELLGLDECIVAVSGAAPLPAEIIKFFRGLQIPVSEIYGLSETCGPLAWSPNEVRIGFVGEPIPGELVALGDDGEVLVKGGNIFNGYYNDEERTAEAIDEQGWFHTGDIGVFENGQLKIVDRKKELIITAGGKNVSPANLEAALKACPYISNACVVGDGQKYLGVLISLESEAASFWAMMAELSPEESTLEALSRNEKFLEEIQKAVDAANETVSSAESIRKFVVLDHEWQPDSDVLTPTMKLKRRVIKEKYVDEIDSMF